MVDVLIVGSGASAVHAAWPLVAAGLRVRMLDFGNCDTTYGPLVPDSSFGEIRHSDSAQHRYFLGDEFEGIDFGHTGAGAQLTPPRQYVARDTSALTPVDSDQFFPIESLALGGLSGAWGAGCPPFRDVDLAGTPLSREALDPHYEAVARRIGISGASDDLMPFFGGLEAMQPPAAIDGNAATILNSYQRKREALNAAGFYMGRPRLAMLTEARGDRGPSSYGDMDFWSDADRAVYRSRYTVEELRRFSGFEYRAPLMVERFIECDGGSVKVVAADPVTGRVESHTAHRLVLAAGTLGTMRIVARSLGLFDRSLPLVCNPHTYLAMINRRSLGHATDGPRHSLAQLCFVLAGGTSSDPATVGHVYSYRSLLLFRLIKDSPLPVPESLGLFRLLLPSLTIAIVQHGDRPSPEKFCRLRRDPQGGPDRLEISYRPSQAEQRYADRVEREIRARFRRLGCLCLRTMRSGHAASVHYAGTFPMTNEDRELTTDVNGRLRGSRAVHLVDGSALPSLPSSGLTFTLMANADRVGSHLARELRR